MSGKQRQHRRSSSETQRDAIRVPTPIIQLDDSEGQQGDADGDQRGCRDMRCRNVVAGNPWEFDPADHQREQTNRHVD